MQVLEQGEKKRVGGEDEQQSGEKSLRYGPMDSSDGRLDRCVIQNQCFKQELVPSILIIFQLWWDIFVAVLMPVLWFFSSVGMVHWLVDNLGTWALPELPPPSPTLSSPILSDLGTADESSLGQVAAFTLVKLMLLVCAGTEQNPGPQAQTSTEVESWEFEEVKDSLKTYKPTRKVCGVCKVGNVTDVSRSAGKGEMMVYTRSGIVKARHPEYRCNSRATNCRALHGHGYFKHKGKKVYESDALKNEILVVSAQTAFEVEYLVEISYATEINSDNFEGLSKLYNRMHNHRLPTATSAKREDLCRKRMTDAYFTYIYLELAQRYDIRNYQVVDSNIDDTILKHKTEMINKFRTKWAVNHRCETPGCGWCLTIDGGLKPHRMLCGAKMSGIRIFPAAGIKIFTGCTKHPSPRSKFCAEHENEESPVVQGASVSAKTKNKLRDERSKNAQSTDAGQDDIYIVESITELRKNESKVKWHGFDELTWEPNQGIPAFIRWVCTFVCLFL